MTLNKEMIGKNFFFIDKVKVDGTSIIESGKLISIIPKYNFRDAFGDSFKREVNILFEVETIDGVTKKAVSSESLVFDKLSDAINYCGVQYTTFAISVIKACGGKV